MVTKRIIPCLDVKDGRVVKGVNFTSLKDAGDPVGLGKKYSEEGADELVFLDITATSDNRETVAKMVEKVAKNVFIPFTVGGGIKTADDIKKILRAGADKVAVNSAAVNDPEIIKKGASIFGSQCIVLAADVKQTNNKYEIYTHGGRKPTGIDALYWIKKAVALGAGEILLTSMDRDGTKIGFDIELTKLVSRAVSVPVIASGGAGNMKDFYEVFTEGEADAALAASLFHYKELTIGEVKNYLANKNIPVRSI